MKWAYGVTTVPSRRETLLPVTLASLKKAGFDRPRLFIDGENNYPWWEKNFPGLELTLRWPTIRTHGNWVLSLYELYIRNPSADRYAIFQDDLLASRNIRTYLEQIPYPEKGYLNLYTFPENERLFPRVGQTLRFEEGWRQSNQRGLGAVGLVFSREAVTTLLSHPHLVSRPQDPGRGWRAIDGGIVDTFRKIGWKEYIHNPSLIQHNGQNTSTISRGGRPDSWISASFRGVEFDALDLLRK